MTRWKKTVGAVAAVMAAAALAGCSGTSTSKGGDTTCGEFKAMSSQDQKEVIKALLSEKGGEPSNGEILITTGSAKLFCATVGSDSSKIREING